MSGGIQPVLLVYLLLIRVIRVIMVIEGFLSTPLAKCTKTYLMGFAGTAGLFGFYKHHYGYYQHCWQMHYISGGILPVLLANL
jgi:hypothetical protein